MPRERFICGYSIYQVPDGSFVVHTLDKDGNELESEPLEFYANAVCELIQQLVKKESEYA